MRTTRLAPSPTGALHLGNARTFLITWLIARQAGWRVVLRVEDLDGPRIKRGAAEQALADLHWLGLDFDGPPLIQSSRRPEHRAAIDRLLSDGAAYPCICTRSEIDLAASAPHADDGATVYPGTCRGRFTTLAQAARAAGRPPAIRFAMPKCRVTFNDSFAGCVKIDGQRLGDFIIAKADSTPAYQLAVVVDDAAQHITDVIRGDDLLDSTPRQIALYEALGMPDRLPAYCHLPLVVGTDGRRLAKRHGDTRLSSFRDAGVTASRILQLLARWCGINPHRPIHTAADLLPSFDLAAIPRHPIIFDTHDDEWLRAREEA